MMKKKIIMIGAAVVLVLGVSLIISSALKPKIVAADHSEDSSMKSAEHEELEKVDSGNVIIENSEYLLNLDCETTHFTVQHKESGKTYSSVASEAEGFVPTKEQQSELIITYYDSNSSKASMNSYENSVEGQSFEVRRNDNTIRVIYSIQKSKEIIFVPDVISQETFEETILANLESGPRRRVKQFYTLFESDGTDSDSKEMKTKYPILEEENLYILNDAAVEHTYSEITKYMNMAGYDASLQEKELERLGIENTGDDKTPAAFVVPVEYTLSEEGLVATILSDKISSHSESYKLTNVSLLPFFASCGASEDGWFLVPDGSGAIIEFKEKSGNTYSQSIWGTDYAVESSVKANLMQNAGMPIWGFYNGDEAIFSVISGGAAVATVNAEVYGNEFAQSHIYTSFDVLSYDTSDMGQLSNKASFNLYASDYVAEFPQVTYMLMAKSNTTYSDMANKYRDYLIAEGVLEERLDELESVPIYIDFTGYETVDESFLGISTQSKTVLSTIEDIKQVLHELEKQGISGVNVRLKAYGNDGIYGVVSNGFEIDRCVGSIDELDELAQYLNKSGGRLYLDNNISTVYNTGNSFDKMTHAVRNLRKMVSKAIDYDLVSREKAEAVNKYYMTSPAYFESLTQNFTKTFSDSSKKATLYGYSWSDFGSKLWSDFNVKMPYDRTQSKDAAVNAISSVTDTFNNVVTDGSNSYVLGNVSTVLNIPLKCSQLNSESYSVPFYQMVIHGYIDYAGAPINVSTDSGKVYLASVESGANLYYSCYTAEEQPLKKTEAGTLMYPTDITSSYEDIVNRYTEYNELFKNLRLQIIVEHDRPLDNVFVTTYEDGTKIAVNYNDKEVAVNNVTIPANGFKVLERGVR